MAQKQYSLSYTTRQTIHQAALSGTFWGAWAFGNFFTIYLQKIGFTASDLGTLNAISSVVGIFSVSFWGTMCDRVHSVKKVETLMLIVGNLLYALVPVVGSWMIMPASMFIFVPILNFFRVHTSTFNENLIVRNAAELRLNYGRVRAIGSLVFTIMSLAATLILKYVDVANSFWMTAVASIVPLILTITSHDPQGSEEEGEKTGGKKGRDQKEKPKKSKLDIKPLLKSKPYLFFLAYAVLFYIASNCEFAFIPYFMKDIGVGTGRYGVLVAYRGFLEIPFLILMSRMRQKISLKNMTILGTVLMAVECLGQCFFVHSLGSMILFATFFGLGNGLFIGGAFNYVYEVAPEGLKASAHGFFMAVSQVSAIIGNLCGGFIYDTIGGRPYYLMTALLYLGAALILLVSSMFLSGKKKQAA